MNPYNILQEPGHEGKFTAQFKARKPHLRHLKSLEQFAHYILAHPTEFNKISKQRANFYKNLIEKHGAPGTYKGGMKSIRETFQPTKEREKYGNKIEKVCSVLDTKRGLFQGDKGWGIGGYYVDASRMRGQSAVTHETPFEDLKDWVNGMEKDILHSDINSLTPTQIEEKITNYVQDNPSIHTSEYNSDFSGKGRISQKMIKDLKSYHRQIGGKISARDFELMLKETYKTPAKRDKHIGDYYIDESLSTPENVVYHNPKTGETKVAYRGTEGTLKDWGNNALFAFGLHNQSKRYKRAADIEKKVEQKYGTENLDVLGHSQSGAFAQEIGKNAKNTIVLNPASHPLYSPKTKNATIVRSKGDSVSALKYLNPLNWGKKADIEIEAKTYNPVTEHMPSVLERLPENTILGNGRKNKNNPRKVDKAFLQSMKEAIKKNEKIRNENKKDRREHRKPINIIAKRLIRQPKKAQELREHHLQDLSARRYNRNDTYPDDINLTPEQQDYFNIAQDIKDFKDTKEPSDEEYFNDFYDLYNKNKELDDDNITIDKDFLKKLLQRETGQIKQIGQKTGLGRKRKQNKKLRNLCCCGMPNCLYC